MIDAPGTVTEVDGDYAVVRMDETGCGRCHEEGGCGGNNLGQMLCSSPRTFRVLNPGSSRVGDHVKVSIAEGAVRRGAVFAYGLPLLLLFAGALCGSAVVGETGAIGGAIAGLLGAWLVLRYDAQTHGKTDQRSRPYIRY